MYIRYCGYESVPSCSRILYTVFMDVRGKTYSLPTPHRKYYYILITVVHIAQSPPGRPRIDPGTYICDTPLRKLAGHYHISRSRDNSA